MAKGRRRTPTGRQPEHAWSKRSSETMRRPSMTSTAPWCHVPCIVCCRRPSLPLTVRPKPPAALSYLWHPIRVVEPQNDPCGLGREVLAACRQSVRHRRLPPYAVVYETIPALSRARPSAVPCCSSRSAVCCLYPTKTSTKILEKNATWRSDTAKSEANLHVQARRKQTEKGKLLIHQVRPPGFCSGYLSDHSGKLMVSNQFDEDSPEDNL